MSAMTSRATPVTSTAAVATALTTRNTSPVATAHSAETSAAGSRWSRASTTPSDTWSQILSGWPRVTDSEEKTLCLGMEILPGKAAARPGAQRDLERLGAGQGGESSPRRQRPAARVERRRPEQGPQWWHEHGGGLQPERAGGR